MPSQLPRRVKNKKKRLINLAVLRYYNMDKNGKISHLYQECPSEECVLKSIQLTREELDYEFTGITCLYAHSMGAIATQTYIQKIQDDFKKIILSGADIGTFKYNLLKIITSKAFKKKDYRLSTKLVHNLTFGSFINKFNEKSDYNWLTVNQENVKNYENDPLCGGLIPDINYYSLANALIKSYKTSNIKKISKNQKILLISGKDDPVSNFGKSTKKLHKRYLKNGINESIIFLFIIDSVLFSFLS